MNIIIAYFENLTHVVGGLEKVICDFSNEFQQRGHTVKIVTFDQSIGRPYYQLEEEIQIINLRDPKYHKLSVIEKLARELYRIFGRAAVRRWKFNWKRNHGVISFKKVVQEFQPDVIVSFETMTSAEIIKEGITVPLITSLQNDPDICCAGLPYAEKEAMEKSRTIHVLLPTFITKVRKVVNNLDVCCIPNVVQETQQQANVGKIKETYRIINVGRLNKKQKRQEILIDAFARLAEAYPQWIVELWGEDTSGYKKEIEKKIKDYQLKERIFFCGVTHDVIQVYCNADIFAFPSKYEGFSLALGEAMSAGLPVVGVRSCDSVRGIIQDKKSGILAEDGADAYAKALEELMKDQGKRVRMGQAAHESMKAYSAQRIWDQWETLLRNVVEKNQSHSVN